MSMNKANHIHSEAMSTTVQSLVSLVVLEMLGSVRKKKRRPR